MSWSKRPHKNDQNDLFFFFSTESMVNYRAGYGGFLVMVVHSQHVLEWYKANYLQSEILLTSKKYFRGKQTTKNSWHR